MFKVSRVQKVYPLAAGRFWWNSSGLLRQEEKRQAPIWWRQGGPEPLLGRGPTHFLKLQVFQAFQGWNALKDAFDKTDTPRVFVYKKKIPVEFWGRLPLWQETMAADYEIYGAPQKEVAFGLRRGLLIQTGSHSHYGIFTRFEMIIEYLEWWYSTPRLQDISSSISSAWS